MSEQEQYVLYLRSKVMQYARFLESLFGPRDPRFEFGTIRLSTNENDVPQTHFPNDFHMMGGCTVDIHVSSVPWKHRLTDQGAWQIAHECVHLLDPGKAGTATVLEEGLCTWFQDESKYHVLEVQKYISRNTSPRPKYIDARDLVRLCMRNKNFITAIKEIRAKGVRIREISPEHLVPYFGTHLTGVTAEEIERLCEKF